MEKRTIATKDETRAALKKLGLTDPMVDDMTVMIEDRRANAAIRVAEIDAQIAQLQNDRDYWAGLLAGYEASQSITATVTIEAESVAEAAVAEGAEDDVKSK